MTDERAKPLATLIGGSGFIGRHLHARLQREGWQCWVPRRGDPALLRRELGHVFYCAGLTADYANRPFDTVEAHSSLLNRVVHAARFESLVYLSSTRLYDGLGDVDATEDLPLALTPTNPRHLYDLSKALGESICHASGRARVARLSCVWGEPDAAEGFLPDLMRRLVERRDAARGASPARIVVDSSPHVARDYVHVADVVDALVLIASRGAAPVYNVAGGRNVDNARLFARLGAAAGCEIVASRTGVAPAPPRISIARMNEEFGWRPGGVLDLASRIVERECTCSSS